MSQRRMTHDQNGDGSVSKMLAAPRRAGESQIRDEERYRMAAFRIRETASRITTLAMGAEDARLRSELAAVCERLLSEERALLALAMKR